MGKAGFPRPRQTHELFRTEIQNCVPLPPGTDAQSLVNRTGRPVTTYQSHECEETGEFETYPGNGTWVRGRPTEYGPSRSGSAERGYATFQTAHIHRHRE